MLKISTFLISGSICLISFITSGNISAQVTPQITPITEQFVPRSSNSLAVQPTLSNQGSITELVHWNKIFGPDAATVDPLTGAVQWEISTTLASESFYIGIKASTPSGYSTRSFIVHVGKSVASEITYVGPSETYTTIKAGLTAMSSGGTMVVRDGTYTGVENFIGKTLPGGYQHPPSGTVTNLTTVMAETPGQVILADNAYIRLRGVNGVTISYAAFKGFFAQDGQIAVFSPYNNARSHHIKFTHCGATGYTSEDFASNPDQQSGEMAPFRAHYSDDIVFENCYAFGAGRYKFVCYSSTNIVFRRNVSRYDRGTHNNEPKGNYSIYQSMDVNVSNNIAIDSDDARFIRSGEIAGDFTTPTSNGDTRATMDRNIQLNSVLKLGNWDDQTGISDTEVRDLISWDIRPAGYWAGGESEGYVYSWGASLFDHVTIGKIRPDYHSNKLFNSSHNHARGIKNSIVHDITNGDLFLNYKVDPTYEIDYNTSSDPNRAAPRYGVATVNLTNYDGALEANGGGNSDIMNLSAIAPLYTSSNTSGALRYLVRVEPGSDLAGMGNDGTDLGANVMTFKGKSGTFYGDTGFDEETNVRMWPFPMEDLIHDKFGAYTYTGATYAGDSYNRVATGTGTIAGNRGFAAIGENLTNYIWGYLGSVVPPMEVTCSTSGVVQWNQSIDDGIDSYKIYQIGATGADLIFIDEVPASVMNYDLNGGAFAGDSYAVVTAVKGSEESSYSYPVLVPLSTLGVSENELEASLLLVYPNPTYGLVQITKAVENVRMFDITGKQVLETTSSTFDISNMDAGMYLIHIKTNNGSVVKSLIKTK